MKLFAAIAFSLLLAVDSISLISDTFKESAPESTKKTRIQP